MFEWGGGYIWCGNDTAFQRFGVGAIDDGLGLSGETLDRLEQLSDWHDQALDWSDPAGPSLWSEAQFEVFDAAARDMLERLRSELGPDFHVEYEEL